MLLKPFSMKYFKALIVSIPFFLTFSVLAQTNDTVVVQAFSFGSPQDAWFTFPSDSIRFEKVYMKYTLKCNPAQSPACGEWDYQTYTYLYDHTGFLDSSVIHQALFKVNGSIADTISFMNTPSYSYNSSWQHFITYTDTTSFNSHQVGNGIITHNHPFGSSDPVSRTQYLWKSNELSAAGVNPGSLTGMSFYLQSLGGGLRNLRIQFKQTLLDSLSSATINDSSYVEVYFKNTQFNSVGWNSIQFTNPFNWDGVSNILVSITYENEHMSIDNKVKADSLAYPSCLINSGNDRVASFNNFALVSIPLNMQVAALDSFVTVAVWVYGSSSLQPQAGSCFEAVDSVGNRILNSHLPWSNSNVYWDAGFASGGYDRINKSATASEIKGQWNFWTFTKNVANGSMKIYLNGNLWHSGTGLSKRMKNIKTFQLGKGNWAGAASYEGRMDDFAVYNIELDSTAIRNIYNTHQIANGPYSQNLVLNYNFNDGNHASLADAAPGNHPPALLVGATNPLKPSDELNKTEFHSSNIRPNVIFEQGAFTSQIDSVMVIDSIVKPSMLIVYYSDSINNPGVATDTLIVWPTYYHNYIYNSLGIAIDSTLATPDNSLYLTYYDHYNIFPEVNRYEMARYITPYGNNLSLGNGWTWTFDVSDYVSKLHDSVHIAAGNWQELLDMKFVMIKGIPPRDVIDIVNLYNGTFNYGLANDPIDNHLPALRRKINSDVSGARWKSRITGHGMDSPSNCAEFCPKSHYFKVNDVTQYTKLVWRDNCDVNPLYPQGGTWVYDRANWCPGAEVWTYDMELTPFINPGDSLTLNHDVQAYINTSGWDNYQIEDQLVTYGPPNFNLDAALENIISPTTDQMYLRQNAICSHPIIVIKNTGSLNLTSLKITYGMEGATPSVFNWVGNLAFAESETDTLGAFNWVHGAGKFTVSISEPNGGIDQYANNNTLVSNFTYPSLMPSSFVIEVKTNNFAYENQYTVKDDAGNTILLRKNLTANTVYKDTLHLTDGCYEFNFLDLGEDGLSFWANTDQGSGYVRFRQATSIGIIKTFGGDFGGQIYQQFTVGLTNPTNDISIISKNEMFVYPNPAKGQINIDFNLTEKKNGDIEIFTLTGLQIYKTSFQNISSGSFETDLSKFGAGVYIVKLISGGYQTVKKVVIY